MSITRSGYEFDGPYAIDSSYIKDNSGVYFIRGTNDGSTWRNIYVGESKGIKSRLERHDPGKCWKKYGRKDLKVFVYYTSKERREAIEKKIRKEYDLPCNKI